jgi:hypothetical protein
MVQQKKLRLTEAKAQRAIAAIVACMRTGQFNGANEQAILDRACDTIRDVLAKQ